jgi:hypothetical protein
VRASPVKFIRSKRVSRTDAISVRPTLAAAFVAMLALACGVREATDVRTEGGTVSGSRGAALDAGPLPFLVPLCGADASLNGEKALQVLIDASGSMTGFSRSDSIAPLVNLAERAASGLTSADFSLRVTRTAIFNRAVGVQTVGPSSGISSYNIGSDTNLDVAVDQASEADLTIIITDGVPFSGGGRAGDCVSGADTGCVARRLQEFVARNPDCGIWAVPAVGQYEGPFSTEGQPVPTDAAYVSRVLANIRGVFPKADPDMRLGGATGGTLAYKGPKYLLNLVLSKKHQLGRAYLRSWMELLEPLRLARLSDDVSTFDPSAHRLGILRASEIYPGLIPDLSSVSVSEPNDRSIDAGTIDYRFSTAGKAPRLEVECVEGEAGRLPLKVLFAPPSRLAGCEGAHVLPFTRVYLKIEESPQGESRATSSFLADARLAGGTGGYEALTSFACTSAQTGSPCDTPATLVLRAGSDYEATAAVLGAAGSIAGLPPLIQLSTDNLPEEPYGVLGLRSLVAQFYRGLASKDSPPLALVELCVTK